MLKKRLGIEAIEKDWSEEYMSDYYKIPSKLSIPEGCKMVGYSAFCGCSKLKRVVIPESVERIEGDAFFECESATIIIILKKPKSEFKEIGWHAFYYCKSVEYAEKEVRN